MDMVKIIKLQIYYQQLSSHACNMWKYMNIFFDEITSLSTNSFGVHLFCNFTDELVHHFYIKPLCVIFGETIKIVFILKNKECLLKSCNHGSIDIWCLCSRVGFAFISAAMSRTVNWWFFSLTRKFWFILEQKTTTNR